MNYGLGSTLPKLVGFLLLPVYTAYLRPADYGIVDLVSTFIALLAILMRLGVPGAVTRFYFVHKDGADLNDYVTTIARFLNVASVIVGAIALLALFLWPKIVLPGVALWPLGIIGVLSALLTSNSDLQRRLIQAREQSSYSARLSFVTAAINIAVALVLVVGFRLGALGLLLAVLVTNAIFFVQARVYLAPTLSGRFRGDMLRASTRYAVGILPSHILGALSPMITRNLLANLDSLSAVGIIGIASRFTSPLALLAGAFNSAYLPVYFSLRSDASAENERALMTTERAVWTAAMAVFVATVVAGPPLIELVTPSDFHGAAVLLPILAVGFLAQTAQTLLGPELFYVKTPWMVPLVTGVALATTLVLMFALVDKHGARGLAVAQSTGLVVAAAASAALSHQLHPVPHAWGDGMKVVVAGIVAIAAVVWFGPVTPIIALLATAPALALYGLLLALTGHPTVTYAVTRLRRYR